MDKPKYCDLTSVAVLVRQRNKLLMIERKGSNFGFAAPAGHQDGLTPGEAAKKELKEEVGLRARKLLPVLKQKLNNPCRRKNNPYHIWTVFEAEAWNGKVKRSRRETKRFFWADRETLAQISKRFESFAKRKKIKPLLKNLRKLQKLLNDDRAWRVRPGLEPPMYFLFKKLGII